MESKDGPASDDDPIVNFILYLGPAGFAAVLVVLCLAGFCVAHRLVSFFYPGA